MAIRISIIFGKLLISSAIIVFAECPIQAQRIPPAEWCARSFQF